MSDNDTIVAQATPPGRGGVGILRISGFKAREVAETVLGKLPKPRYADYLPFKDADGSVLDQGIALWFPWPELVHRRRCAGTARSWRSGDPRPAVKTHSDHSRPADCSPLGEFSERAFLNDKLDLAQSRGDCGSYRRQFGTGGPFGT